MLVFELCKKSTVYESSSSFLGYMYVMNLDLWYEINVIIMKEFKLFFK